METILPNAKHHNNIQSVSPESVLKGTSVFIIKLSNGPSLLLFLICICKPNINGAHGSTEVTHASAKSL